MADRTLHSIVREARAVAEALASHTDDNPDAAAEGLARLRALAGLGLRRLGLDPEADEFDAHLDRLADAARGPRTVVVLDGVIELHPTGPASPHRPNRLPPEAGARGRPDLGGGAPLEHEHSWPNPYTSCTCGAPPPDDPGPVVPGRSWLEGFGRPGAICYCVRAANGHPAHAD